MSRYTSSNKIDQPPPFLYSERKIKKNGSCESHVISPNLLNYITIGVDTKDNNDLTITKAKYKYPLFFEFVDQT